MYVLEKDYLCPETSIIGSAYISADGMEQLK